MMERHKFLRRVSRTLLSWPGLKPVVRVLVRSLIQQAPLSQKNRERLYNFFANDTIPEHPLRFTILTPGHHSPKSLVLELDLQDDLSRQWYYWGYEHYERGTTHLIRRLAPIKSCMFDIGANIGYYTLLMASLVDGRGEVHAFEPWPEVFDWLAHNAELNHFGSLHLQKKAVSDTDGKQPLFLPSNRHWTNASLVEGFTTQGSCFDIETVRLDSYCRTREIQQVDLVKIDVEGAELKVLQGMGELIDRWSPDIVCEVLSGYEDELDAFLAGSAYRKFLITDNGLEEVDKLQAHATFRDYYLSCNPINCLP